jgi:hypothetical protein
MKPLKTTLMALLASPIIFTAHGPAAFAQEPALVAPEPLLVAGRFMPGFADESIAKARYTVKADGTVDAESVEIIPYLSNQFLNAQLIETVKGWTFTPGTINGAPADFHNQEYVFAMRVNPNAPPMPMGGPGGRGGPGAAPPAAEGAAPPAFDPASMPPIPLMVSAKVKSELEEITALMTAKDYGKAEREVDRLLREEIHTLVDNSLTHDVKASVMLSLDNPYAALEESKLATLSAINPQGAKEFFLPNALLQTALRKKFLLAASLKQNALALEAYNDLIANAQIPAEDKIHEQAKALQAQLDSPDPLGLLTQITDEKWSYKPTHRIFTVAGVDGKLDGIIARCERRDLELEYQEGVDWTLPASLGACELEFAGKDGTKFEVYEFAE